MNQQPKVGVGIWVIHEDKLLLGQRINSHGNETWSPPGGHLELFEPPEKTVVRELFEETALKAKKVLPLIWTNDLYLQENKHYISLHYLVTEFSGELKVREPNKCKGWQWFDFDHYPKPLFISAQNLLDQVSFGDYLQKSLPLQKT